LTGTDLWQKAEALLPKLKERAPKCEELRRLPDETLRDFHDAQLFRIHQPKRVGGAELEFAAVVTYGALFARVCASTAWNWVNFAAHHMMLGMFPPQAQDEIWGQSRDALIASSFVFPAGKARKVAEVFVPEHMTLAVADTKGGPTPGSAVNPGILFQLPVFALFPYMLSGVALGIAEGLIEDYKPASGKMTGARVAEIQSTQIRLAEATAYARISRLVQLSNCREAEAKMPDMKTKARYRLEGAYAVDWAVRAVDVMFGLYGAGGLYESGPVARAFRDAHAVKQHFSFNTDIAGTTYGRVALGLASDNPTL